jgi:hypothetical protein
MNRDVTSETKGLNREKPQDRPSITGGLDSVATAEQAVYRGRRDPTAPVDEVYTVTMNGDECLPSDTISYRPHRVGSCGRSLGVTPVNWR